MPAQGLREEGQKEEEIKGTDSTPSTHPLSKLHLRSHLLGECSQSLFLHEETVCVCAVGEAAGLGPEARGPVR